MTSIELPRRLKDPRLRFVLLRKKDKAPIEGDWQTFANYRFDDPKLLDHIGRGNNYGVLCGFSGLAVIDADKKAVAEAAEKGLPPTFTVKTGRESGEGRQFYYFCPDLTETIRLSEDGTAKGEIGDVHSTHKQVVGPGSIHPKTGNRYEVIDDREIATVSRADITRALSAFIDLPKPDHKEARPPGGGKSLNDQLRIEDVIDLSGFERHGDRYQGPHPMHGSETGHNLSVDVSKNVWYCHRCSRGGGPFEWIAVREGIIDCRDCGKGALRDKETFKKVLKVAQEKDGLKLPEKRGGFRLDKSDDEERKQLITCLRPGILDKIDIFEDEEGVLFVAYVPEPLKSSMLEIHSLDEWKKKDEVLGQVMEEEALELKRLFPVPGDPRPYLEVDDYGLLEDVIRKCFGQTAEALPFVELPDRYEDAAGCYIIATQTPELNNKHPRDASSGTTETGKGRKGSCYRFLCRRAIKTGEPSPAFIYHMVDRYRATLIIEELDSADKDKFAKIMNLYRLGYDGDPVGLCDIENNNRPRIYQTGAFMAVSFKLRNPREDDLNRSICFPMESNVNPVNTKDPVDDEEFKYLRARLLAHRLKVLTGRIDHQAIMKKVDETLDAGYPIDGIRAVLKSRERTNAAVLMFASEIYNGKGVYSEGIHDDIIYAVHNSRLKAIARQRDNFETTAGLALVRLETRDFDLEDVAIEEPEKRWAKDIAKLVEDTLRKRGTIDDENDLKKGKRGRGNLTSKTVQALESAYKFKFNVGHASAKYIDPEGYEEKYIKMGIRLREIGAFGENRNILTKGNDEINPTSQRPDLDNWLIRLNCGGGQEEDGRKRVLGFISAGLGRLTKDDIEKIRPDLTPIVEAMIHRGELGVQPNRALFKAK